LVSRYRALAKEQIRDYNPYPTPRICPIQVAPFGLAHHQASSPSNILEESDIFRLFFLDQFIPPIAFGQVSPDSHFYQ
jgi:hypothetical protein